MGDTYNSAAEAEADRAQQKALLVALNAWDRALRWNECGAWCLRGKHHDKSTTRCTSRLPLARGVPARRASLSPTRWRRAPGARVCSSQFLG